MSALDLHDPERYRSFVCCTVWRNIDPNFPPAPCARISVEGVREKCHELQPRQTGLVFDDIQHCATSHDFPFCVSFSCRLNDDWLPRLVSTVVQENNWRIRWVTFFENSFMGFSIWSNEWRVFGGLSINKVVDSAGASATLTSQLVGRESGSGRIGSADRRRQRASRNPSVLRDSKVEDQVSGQSTQQVHYLYATSKFWNRCREDCEFRRRIFIFRSGRDQGQLPLSADCSWRCFTEWNFVHLSITSKLIQFTGNNPFSCRTGWTGWSFTYLHDDM